MTAKKGMLESLIESKKGLSSYILVLIVLGAFVAGFVLFLAGRPLLFGKDIAQLIPEEETIAFVEVKNGLLPPPLRDGQFTPETIGQLTQTFLGFNLNELSPGWGKRRFGVVAVSLDSRPAPVFFFDMGSKRKIAKRLEEMNLVDSGGSEVMSHSQKSGRYFGILGTYLITSTEHEAITLLLSDPGGKRLSESLDYQKTISHLPRLSWAKAYVNPQKWTSDEMVKNMLMEPLKFAVNHVALTVKKDSNGFHFNAFSNLKKDVLSLNHASTQINGADFSYELTRFIDPEKVGLYMGGRNLFDEWQNTLESMANLNPSYSLLLESLVRAQFAEQFGEGVSLRNDFYPLFDGEYAFWVGGAESGQTTYQLLLTHQDKEFVEIKLSKLMEGFKQGSGRFEPEVRIVELPDGTQSRELVASESFQEVEVETYEDQELHCLESLTSAKRFCYTVGSDWLTMTNSKASLMKTVQLSTDPTGSLRDAQHFRRHLSSLSQVTDELSYLQFDVLAGAFEANPYVLFAKPFLASFDSSTWVKHSFDDGMSWEGFVLLK